MSEFKEWIIALAIGGAIYFCTDGCENREKKNKSQKPIYTEWQPTTTPNNSYSNSQSSSYNTHSNSNYNYNSNYNSSANQTSKQTQTQSYSYSPSTHSSTYSSSNDSYREWETEDIEGFYVELDNCRTDKDAEFLSDKYYYGEYIKEGSDYYAKTDLASGLYEVELGDRISNKFFNIKGSDYYIRFKWSTSLWKWDEGIMDIWNNKGTFYIKPD